MSTRTKTGIPAAVLTAMAIALAGCDSALITGTGAAPEIGAANAPTLLADGNFELGGAAWEACSDAGNSDVTADASDGSLALQVGGGACRYQNLNADTARSYRLSCDTKQNTAGWSSVTMAFLDQNNNPLDLQELPVTAESFTTTEVTMTAPEFTSHLEILFYSDGDMTVDNCQLSEVTLDVPSIALVNGSFDNGQNGWSQCSAVEATITNGIATLANGACLNQSTDISAAVAASAANDPLTVTLLCDQITKGGGEYAATIIAFLDENNNPVANNEQSIAADATSTSIALAAPSNATTMEVMLYSNATVNVGQCSITTL